MMAVNMANQHRWSKNKDLRAWVAQSRLDGFAAMAHQVKPTDTEKMAILQRYAASAGPAAANLRNLLAWRGFALFSLFVSTPAAGCLPA